MSVVTVAVGWLGVSGPARAADPDVVITVTPTPQQVTFRGQALQSHAAYQVTITNRGNNVVNHVRFVAETQVFLPNGSAPGAAAGDTIAPFVESIGLQCSPTNASKTKLECSIGKLLGRGGAAAFVVVVRAPIAGAAPNSASDRIDFGWRAFYGEGSSDTSHASHIDTQQGTAVTRLATPSATKVTSFVPSSGGTVFTGKTGIATKDDQWTTSIKVPKAALADVQERKDLQSCSPDLPVCFLSNVTIPGTFGHPFLVVKLRRDASSIKYGANIANATVAYKANPDDAYSPYVDLPSCSYTNGVPTPAAPRCIKSRIKYTKHTAPTPDHVGDWEFVIWAISNGSFRF